MVIFGIILLILIISLFFNYRFFNHYAKVPKYPCKYYKNIKFKTGDLILFKSLTSFHLFITGQQFSHVGIVLEYNRQLYCLEMYEPNVKITPLFHRFNMFKDGYIAIKQLNKPVNINDKINKLFEWSETLEYPKETFKISSTFIKSCVGDIWDTSDKSDIHCAKYILHCMKYLELLNGNEKIQCNTLDYLINLKKLHNGYEYSYPCIITFFGETCLSKYEDFWSLSRFKKY